MKFLIGLIFFMGLSSLAQATGQSREYYLKAAFLRYVVQYTEWPTNAVPKDKLNICLLGQIPSFEGLNSITGKVVNDRALNLEKLLDLSHVKDQCQMLFVSKTEEDKTPDIVNKLKGSPILVFGDLDGFAAKGGAMNFYIANNRLAIMANLRALREAHLNLNPKMLKLITVVPQTDES